MDYNNLILFLCVVIFKTVVCQGYSSEEDSLKERGKVFGGDCIHVKEAYYQASLFLNETSHKCGAVIIAELWLLTAAHCVDFVKSNPKLVKNYTVVTGNSQIFNDGERHSIEKIILHPSFNITTYDSDIALIKLQKSIIFNTKQRNISITDREDIPNNEKMEVFGFGRTSSNDDSSKCLRKATVKKWRRRKCRLNYEKAQINITNNMFCAGGGSGDTCSGDSGGPAVFKSRLYGIVSFGNKNICGSDAFPGVYTAVYNYRQWIEKITGLNIVKKKKKLQKLKNRKDVPVRNVKKGIIGQGNYFHKNWLKTS